MVPEIISSILVFACFALILYGWIYWLKSGASDKFFDNMEKSAERGYTRLEKELKQYKKALKQMTLVSELKDLEIEELKEKEKQNGKKS